MNTLNEKDYFSKLKDYFDDIDERLNSPDKEALEKLRNTINKKGYEFDSQLKSLYEYADGENDEMYSGLAGGFTFISAKKALDEFLFFADPQYASIYEFKRKYTDAVQEDTCDRLCWIPFAHDGSRCFFAVDMTPDKTGKKGQVIAMDGDLDRVYLMADSLYDFFSKTIKYLHEGLLTIESEDDDIFIEGDLLDIIDEIQDN